MPSSPAIALTETASYPSLANRRSAVLRILSFVSAMYSTSVCKRSFTYIVVNVRSLVNSVFIFFTPAGQKKTPKPEGFEV